jgi:hypothetical protein
MSKPAPVERELSAGDAIAALDDAFQAMTGAPKVQFSGVKDIDVRKAGRWILIRVRYTGKDSNEVTFRIRKAWAQTLRQRLNRALD